MKQIIWISIFLISVLGLSAQTEMAKKFRLTTATDEISLTAVDLLDPYLSPLVYTGVGLGYQHTERRFFNAENPTLSMESKLSALAAMTQNPQFTSATSYLGANYSWGTHYHFRPIKDLQVLAGGTADADFGFKSNSRNVNNPVNLDMAVNINLSAEARYDFHIKRKTLRLSYRFDTPLLGCMYVPLSGASYYEMFELGNLNNAFHVSSLHNKLGSATKLMLDVPFRHSTWRFGINTLKLRYEANDIFFKQNRYNFVIGWMYDFHIFKGLKNPAPTNFVGTNY
jgi:hypothetical protein